MPATRVTEVKPTIVCFVRHGTTPTTGKVLPGQARGLHLADLGREQAAATAERLAGLGSVRAVYASNLERAKETAGAIANACGLRVVVDRRLADADVGDWTNRKLTELVKLPAWKSLMAYRSGFRFPGGESFPEMQARISNAVHAIVERHPGEVVVAVSHADPIQVALGDALGQPLDMIDRMMIANCSVSVVSYHPSGPRVLAVNSVGSLAMLGIAARTEKK